MRVRFRPRAEEDLTRLYEYMSSVAGADTAFEFVWRLRASCLSLSEFPHRGIPRDDILKGLRVLALERLSLIAYKVESEVVILAIFHGGQNWTDAFAEKADETR